MPELDFVAELILILLSAFLGGFIAEILRLPLVVGYLFVGVLSGSFIRGLFPSITVRQTIAEIGVALLLFSLGLEFSLTRLKELGGLIITTSAVQILLSIILAVVFFPLFGIDFYTALFIGAAFSLSSTVVALKTFTEKGELETLHAEVSSGWLFMQDLWTLPLIIILPSIGFFIKGEAILLFSFIGLLKSLCMAFFSFFLILYLGKKIVPVIFDKIVDVGSSELTLISAVTFCLVFAYLVRGSGYSMALGSFLAGILLSSSSAKHGIFAQVRPLTDLFASVFFVSLGFILNPSFLTSSFAVILVITFFVIFSKFLIGFLLMMFLGYHSKTSTVVGFSLASIGEFAFILAILGISNGLISQNAYLLVLSSTFVSLVISPTLIGFSDKNYYLLKNLILKLPFLSQIVNNLDRESIVRTETFSDHVVILGHGRVGKYIAHSLSMMSIPFVVVDLNHRLVKKLRSLGFSVIYGDPAEIDVLNFAQIQQAKVVVLAYADRLTQESVVANIISLNPKTKIIARSHYELDFSKLKRLGVTSIVWPEFEAALSMTEKLMQIFNIDKDVRQQHLTFLRKKYGMC